VNVQTGTTGKDATGTIATTGTTGRNAMNGDRAADGGITANENGGGNGSGGDAAERMRQAIRAAADGGGSVAELQTAARELVTHLKRQHVRPEQMLIRIKEVLAEAGIRQMHSPQPTPEAFANTPGSVYRNVIAWSIRYYYDGDGPS
jgi:hypothetical protein